MPEDMVAACRYIGNILVGYMDSCNFAKLVDKLMILFVNFETS